MLLYHGSPVPGIAALRPSQSGHDKPYAYLTNSPELAVLYARNPLPRPYGWFPYLWREGNLWYDEYFPNATEEIYKGRAGYVYSCEAELPTLEKMPWVYVSGAPVPVSSCRFIPDIYEELLRFEREGRLHILRYAESSPAFREQTKQLLLREIENNSLRDKPNDPYAMYIHQHFPDLL